MHNGFKINDELTFDGHFVFFKPTWLEHYKKKGLQMMSGYQEFSH